MGNIPCPACNKPVDADSAFCKSCGGALNNELNAQDLCPVAPQKASRVQTISLVLGLAFLGLVIIAAVAVGLSRRLGHGYVIQGESQTQTPGSGSNNIVSPATNSGFELSQDQMRAVILNRGIWNSYSGLQKYSTAEILRVGQFNTEKKYWPVQVRVTWGTGENQSRVWNCIIYKDNYGDWAVRAI